MQSIFMLVCHSVNSAGGPNISHVEKVIETTTDQAYVIYGREIEALYQRGGVYNPHILYLDRPADLSFLHQLAQAQGEKKEQKV